MYSLLAITSNLLLLLLVVLLAASSTALTVTDTAATAVAPKGFTPGRDSYYGPVDPPAVASADNACCADYPFCGCPKLESPAARIVTAAATKKKKNRKPFVRLPPAKRTAAVRATARNDSPCCPDYPFCGCPKLEAPSRQKKSRIKVIHVGAVAKRKASPLMVRRSDNNNNPKSLVGASTKGTYGCCPDYPYCSCPKI